LFFCELEVEEEGLHVAAPNNWYQSQMIPKACGDGVEIPLKPTMVVAANFMQSGGRPREIKAVGGAMPLAAECSALPQQGGDGVIPLRTCTIAWCRHEDRRIMPVCGGVMSSMKKRKRY
jgi:hypothetical protein